MFDHTAAMLAFIKLAGVSQSRQQLLPRDKFLMLAAVSAAEAGCPEVAARCRELIVAHNPAHLIGHHASVEQALMTADFQTYLRQLSRFCSYERAEHLLTQLELAPGLPPASAGLNPAEYALLLLGNAPGT